MRFFYEVMAFYEFGLIKCLKIRVSLNFLVR